MTMEPPPPPAERVSADDVRGLRDDIAGLRRDLYGDGTGTVGVIGFLRSGFRGNRWRIRLIVLSLCADLVLTFLVVVGASGANSACRASNEARAAQRSLWGYVLQVNERQRLTPGQRATVNDFKVYVDRTFAPRNCSFWSDL